MRTLFVFDYKDYKEDGTVGIRPSARANLEHPHGKLSGEEMAGHLFRRVEALIGKLKDEGLL